MGTSDNSQTKVLSIKMLGDFMLSMGDRVLSGDRGRSKQVWNLLEYLLIHRNKEISPDKLMDALWEEEVDNPANALKNLVYRLRTMLSESLGMAKEDYIIYKHGTYAWNTAAPYVIDIDLFENAWKNAQKPVNDPDGQLNQYLNVVSLYKGDFLTHSSYKEWVVPLAVYYQRIYMECVAALCELLFKKQDFNRVEEICLNAISIDPLIEKNHELLIMALIASNNNNKALIHYDYVTDLFYKEVGVKPSESITRLYKIIVNKEHSVEKNIDIVRADLREVEQNIGAVFCDYEAFKLVYRINARAALRSGKSVYIALLSFTKVNKSEFQPKELNDSMEKIKSVIMTSLRKDDLITRFSRTQYLVLLSNINFENTEVVLNKLVQKINKACQHSQLTVTGHLQPLEPIELIQMAGLQLGGV